MSVSAKHSPSKSIFIRTGFAPTLLVLLGAFLGGPAHAQDVITFDNLTSEPNVAFFTPLQAANKGTVLDGVTFSAQWYVVGNQYVDSTVAGLKTPTFLDSHSGNYLLYSPLGSEASLTTGKTLYGFWAARPEYSDGTGLGSSDILVDAVDANGKVLGSVNAAFQTKTPTFIDTSSFASLTGVAGYDFRPDNANWPGHAEVGIDDLTFSPANPVPEASTTVSFGLLLTLGLGGLVVATRRRKRSTGHTN